MFTHRPALRTVASTLAACALTFAGLTSAQAAAPTSVSSHTSASAPSKEPFMNYAVLVKPGDVGALNKAKTSVANAGGTVLTGYPAIGVLYAQSNNPGFITKVKTDTGVQAVGPTRHAPVVGAEIVAAPADLDANGNVIKPNPALSVGGVNVPASASVDGVPEWDMKAIGADKANEINPGSPKVTVAIIDSGVDSTHPNLKGRIDLSRSVGCQNNGIPDVKLSGPTVNTDGSLASYGSHGTHVAGTVGAALTADGRGINGVAPKTSMISINAMNAGGFFYPEYVTCAFEWAMNHNVQVTNNSYYIDPWLFWCADQADQKASIEAVSRIVAQTQTRGILNVAAAGNSNVNLDNKTTDSSSPNDIDGDAIPNRPVKGCITLPTELPGTVIVSANAQSDKANTGPNSLVRSGFSNYGSAVTVSAPGSAILSTVPGGKLDVYNGTSMASPHVAGVAALLAATHPKASIAEMTALLKKQATPHPCPSPAGVCVKTTNGTNEFGAGVVNALAAVTQDLPTPPPSNKPTVYSVPTSSTLYSLSGTGAATRAKALTFNEWVALGAPQPAPAPAEYVKYTWSNDIFMVNKWNSASVTWTWTHLNAATYRQAGYPSFTNPVWIPGTTVTKFATSDELFSTLGSTTHKLNFSEWKAMNFAKFRDAAPAGYIRLNWNADIYFTANIGGGASQRLDFNGWRARAFPTPAVLKRYAGDQFLKSRTTSDIFYVNSNLRADRKMTFDEWVKAGAPQPTGTH